MVKQTGRRALQHSAADIKRAAKKLRLHFHGLPRCTRGKHDKRCGSRKELFCAQVTVGPIKFCSCAHA